jgi:hypothetical protein
MPLKLNVGLSRKVGEPNYSSRGASVNIDLEVDSSLVNEPAKLQEKIRQLFHLVRASLAQELQAGNAPGRSAQPDNGAATHPAPANHKLASNHAPSSGAKDERLATASQAKAIYAIARSQRLDLPALLRERYQADRPDDLTLKEASALIDSLKGSASREGRAG